MKTKKSFIWSLSSLVISVIALLFFILENSRQQEDYSFMVIVTAQVISATFVLMNWPKQKPNYDWAELEEHRAFTILAIGEDFTETAEGSMVGRKNLFGRLVVNVDSFGPTLMIFPTTPIYWNSPVEKNGKYMRHGKMIIKC